MFWKINVYTDVTDETISSAFRKQTVVHLYTSLQRVMSSNAFVFIRNKSNIESVISLSKWTSLR